MAFPPPGATGSAVPNLPSDWTPPFPATGQGDESPQEQPSKIAGVNHAPLVPVPRHRLRREMGLGSSDSGWGGMDGQIGLTPTAPILGLNLLLSDPKHCWGWFHTPGLCGGAGRAAALPGWLIPAAGLVGIIHPDLIFEWRSPGSGSGGEVALKTTPGLGHKTWFNASPGGKEPGPTPDAGVQGCSDARPSGDPPSRHPSRGCTGTMGTQSRGGGTHKGPSVRDKSCPVLPAWGHPWDGREGPDPATAGAPSWPCGRGMRVPSLAPQAGGGRRVLESPRVLRLRGSWAVLGRRVEGLRGGAGWGVSPLQGHRAPLGNGGGPPGAHL